MGEFVLQVESTTINDTVKVPIAVLKAGELRSVQTVLEFPDAPVTFKLVEGNGPVYIHGQQLPGNYEIEGATMMSEEEEDGVSTGTRKEFYQLRDSQTLTSNSFFGSQESDEDEENAKENCKNSNNKKSKKKNWTNYERDGIIYVCYMFDMYWQTTWIIIIK